MSVAVMFVSGACGDAGTPAPAAPVKAVPAATAAPRSLIVVRSAARVDWPCGIDVLLPGDLLNEINFIYEGPAECLMPVDLHSDGILGCPTREIETSLSTGQSRTKTLAYDAEGRLVERHDPGFRRTYEWSGQEVVSLTYWIGDRPPFLLRYRESDDTVRLVETDGSQEPVMSLRFADRHLVDLELREGERITITWDGPRLRRLDYRQDDGDTFYRLLYDCDHEGAANTAPK